MAQGLGVHRARAQPGRGPCPARSPPGAPRRRGAKRSNRRGGMGLPPWGFLGWGAPRKGGFQGGKPRRGARGAPCADCLAGRRASLSRVGGGQSGAQAAAVTISDVAVDDGSTGAPPERKRAAKRRRASRRAPASQRSGRHQRSSGWRLARAAAASPGASHRPVRSGCLHLHHPSSCTSFSSASSKSSALGFAAAPPLRSSRAAG